ncbi:MAG: hypothetical protein Kow0077_10620 [Anaerolineae bacterium]
MIFAPDAGHKLRWSELRRWLAWGWRAVLVIGLLAALRPASPRAILGPPQTVETQQPLLCMHTRLIDEVEAWKIQRSLQMVRELGADTIVEFFPWAYAEPAPGQYRWEQADLILQHAANQGLQVIARLGMVPAWARPDARSGLLAPGQTEFTTLNYLDREHYADFARYVAAFVARYRGLVQSVIIWNEPNLAFEWGYRQVSPSEYVELLQAAYTAAKAANPEIIVLAAPMAPTLEPEGSPWGMNDLRYIELMYEAGAAPYFDAMAVHTYGFTEPPEADPAPDTLNFRRVELIHAIMARYGDADKPLYITESGWNDHPRWTKAVSPAERITYTISSYEWIEDHMPTVKKLCQWVLRYPAPTRSYPDNFTFLTEDFRPRVIYSVLQAYAHGEEIALP